MSGTFAINFSPTSMPRLALILLLALAGAVPNRAGASAPRAATLEELTLITESLEKTAGDLGRWAYTETQIIRDEKGRIKTETVVRHDPSKPYAEQWTPLRVNGKPPGESDLKKYRRRGEQAARRDDNPSMKRQPSLGELIDLSRATVVGETDQALTFNVPLRKENNNRFPPEKFEVLARIGKEGRGIQQIAVRLREPFRAKLIVKVKSGEGTLEFAAFDDKHPPTLTSIRGDASASIFFISIGGEIDLKRTELKHVKPFGERFDVQIGTLKALDF
jgi:hypothetical protein